MDARTFLRPLLVVLALLAAQAPPGARGETTPAPSDPPEVARLLALMERAAPSSRAGTPGDGLAFPGWKETPAERGARYREIARAAWKVASAPGAPSLFTGKDAQIKTAAGILAVALHESGYAKDVDLGPCYRAGGQRGRCDGGKAHCMMQIQPHVWDKARGLRTTREGYSGGELFADRGKCLGSGLRELAASQKSCGHRGWSVRFASFASGACDRGHKSAKELADLVDSFAARVTAPAK